MDEAASVSMPMEDAIAAGTRLLGIDCLKPKPVKAFVSGNDTFVSLPTGYGKSIIYAILPLT